MRLVRMDDMTGAGWKFISPASFDKPTSLAFTVGGVSYGDVSYVTIKSTQATQNVYILRGGQALSVNAQIWFKKK